MHQSPRALVLALALTATVLAGCSGGGKADDDPTTITDPGQLEAGKGAISGLLIDDRFRPITGGLILLQPLGLTATSNANGEFQFVNLDPGQYTARATAEGHEAAPQPIRVDVGKFAELNLEARRVFSEGSRIVTSEFSVFIPCAVDYVANGNVLDCTLDQSGDSFRAGFDSNYTAYSNATYLVNEMKANKLDRYEVQLRCETPDTYLYYAVDQFEGDYSRMVLQKGATNVDHVALASYGENVQWDNDCTISTILFTDSVGREEIQSVAPVCCGVGVHAGIRATFVQSLFLGAPDVDISSYHVLSPE